MLFRRKKNKPVFFEEESVDIRFRVLADFVKDLDSRADYNKAIGAMESIFNAYQKLRGIKNEDDVTADAEFVLHEKESE